MTRYFVLLAALSLSILTACTGMQSSSRVHFSRSGDTLTVALDPGTSARWSPLHDRLVVECEGCSAEESRVTEFFEDRTWANYEIAGVESLKFSLYLGDKLDTVYTVAGLKKDSAAWASSTKNAIKPLPNSRRVERSSASKSATKTETKPQAKAEPKSEPKTDRTEKVETKVKKAASLRVSAVEGVAVYKDKSKKEVIKILPRGATLPLIAREGDMYSVIVGDSEGFVEAEAVKIDQ